MDTSKARTEAAAVYKERQATLDAHIRIGAVAFGLLGRIVDGKNGDRVLGEFYGALGKKIRPVQRVPRHEDTILTAYQRNIVLSLAAVQTDFESACRDLLSDVMEFWPSSFKAQLAGVRPPPDAPHTLAKRGWAGCISEVLRSSSAGADFVKACYNFLELTPTDSDLERLPIFEYFRRCRNRVIHQDGTAGLDLATYSQSKELLSAVNNLPASVKAMVATLTTLPETKADEQIVMEPTHCILFLIVARSLFDALAAKIQKRLSDEGYLRMAAYYAYGPPFHAFRLGREKHVVYPARRFLSERYNVTGTDKDVVIQRFRELDLWDSIVKQYHELFVPGQTTSMKRPERHTQTERKLNIRLRTNRQRAGSKAT
ncbi:MAG: hypothetical protein WCL71_02545 [Deltaproteobacteria bacterium]